MNKDEALKMAIEEIQDLMQHIKDRQPDMLFTGSEYVINACKEALATNEDCSVVQPAQEPVLPFQRWSKEGEIINQEGFDKLNNTQPHQWQGLTDDEIDDIIDNVFSKSTIELNGVKTCSVLEGFRAIEQALKEKNT